MSIHHNEDHLLEWYERPRRWRHSMDANQKRSLDRWITGNYGMDQEKPQSRGVFKLEFDSWGREFRASGVYVRDEDGEIDDLEDLSVEILDPDRGWQTLPKVAWELLDEISDGEDYRRLIEVLEETFK